MNSGAVAGRKRSERPQENSEGDDIIDLFAEHSDVDNEPVVNAIDIAKKNALQAPSLTRHPDDVCDDEEGYYRLRLGEVVSVPNAAQKYVLAKVLGRGVFGQVFLAHALATSGPAEEKGEQKETQGSECFAIKMSRNADAFRRALRQEAAVLRKLQQPQACQFVVRMVDTFEYRSHECIVFELLHSTLRDVLHRHGTKEGELVGVSLAACRTYSRQLLAALVHLQQHGVVHGDIKPDNVLVTEDLRSVRLADFGSAQLVTQIVPNAELGSRFYRAPEVMRGLAYGPPADVWSLACTIFELFTGSVLFSGRDNAEMLMLIQSATHKIKALRSRVAAQSSESRELADVLERCFTVDPRKRPSAADLLRMPFFSPSSSSRRS
jgi:serine/threonine-protein kinase PRP4